MPINIYMNGARTVEEVRQALRAGADANKQDEGGWTALMVAAQHGGEHGAGMVRLLVDAGADGNKQNENGWTALMYAARYGGEHAAGMMRLLVDAGAAVSYTHLTLPTILLV